MASQASTSGSAWSCAPFELPTRPRQYSLRGARSTTGCAGRHLTRIPSFSGAAQSGEQMMIYPEIEYSPEANEEYWDVRPVKVMNRAMQIGRAFSGWFLSSKIFGDGGIHRIDGHQAERLRRILTNLGPAFVKIGQALSSRPDIAPPSFLRELEKLQDNIPPFADAEAMRIIKTELGQPVSAIFSEISATSVAAASLGQVYKAKVRSSGQWVAVKVQRPHVRENIALDVHIMRILAGQLGRVRRLNSDLPSLLDEWAGSLFRELDYKREAENGTLFRQLYSHLEGIYVPEMVHELTTGRVLTMEWLDGVRLRSAGQSPSDGQTLRSDEMKLIEFGVQCSLEQMLEEGFYHADPHPGNLLRLKNGKLGYMDFGMMASIRPSIRRSLIRATLHMVNREFESLASDFESLGLLPQGSEKEKVVPALAEVFEKALSGGVSNMSFGTLGGDLGKTMYDFKFRIPAYYILLVRSLSVLEGIALSSDPNYKVLGAAYPWIARRLLSSPNPELQETLQSLLYKDNKFQFHRLESLLRQALRSPARQNRGAEKSASDSSLSDKPLELLLGNDGSFVRDVLLDEMAKGIDAAIRLSADSVIGRARSRLASFFKSATRQNTSSGDQSQSLAMQQGSASLLQTLKQLPKLSDKSDAAQVKGIQSLVTVLQDVRSRQADRSPASAAEQPSRDVGETVTMLQWFLQELGRLSPAARREALMIPLSLGGRLSSRLVARAVKAFANRDEAAPSPSALPRTVVVSAGPPETSSIAPPVTAKARTARSPAVVTSRPASENDTSLRPSPSDEGALVVANPARSKSPGTASVPVKALQDTRHSTELSADLMARAPVMNGTSGADLEHLANIITDKDDAEPQNEPQMHQTQSPDPLLNGTELTASDANTWDWRVKRLYQRQQALKQSNELVGKS